VNTNVYKKYQQRKKKRKGLDAEQIYGHGSQRGSMPGMTVPLIAGSKILLLLL
jgi:hypothetical protein